MFNRVSVRVSLEEKNRAKMTVELSLERSLSLCFFSSGGRIRTADLWVMRQRDGCWAVQTTLIICYLA